MIQESSRGLMNEKVIQLSLHYLCHVLYFVGMLGSAF